MNDEVSGAVRAPIDLAAAMLNPRVLIVEDNQPVGETIQRFLERSGMSTVWAQTGTRAYELKTQFQPDVVLVDLELPDVSGAALIEWLATQQDCGIIVVSGRAEEGERLVGLELGARIRAVHRRAQRRANSEPAQARMPPVPVTVHRIGPYRVDTRARSVTTKDGQIVPLTGAEFMVLHMLLEADGQPVSRSTLCDQALRRPWRAEDRSIDQLVFHLRRKLSEADSNGRLIQAVRGAGYFLVAEA